MNHIWDAKNENDFKKSLKNYERNILSFYMKWCFRQDSWRHGYRNIPFFQTQINFLRGLLQLWNVHHRNTVQGCSYKTIHSMNPKLLDRN